jgi:LPXTG-motif cell wall-anchored protein
MPYTTRVAGPAPINYRAEPLDDDRREGAPGSLFSAVEHGDPATPLLEAYAGDALRINVLSAWSEQPQAFSIEGHQWPIEPAMAGSNLVSTVQLVGMESVVIFPEGGAGGRSRQAGDYVYGNHREPYREAGMWGLLRVHPEPVPGLQPLAAPCGTPGAPACAAQAGVIGPVLLGLTAVGAAAGWFMRRRRRKQRAA